MAHSAMLERGTLQNKPWSTPPLNENSSSPLRAEPVCRCSTADRPPAAIKGGETSPGRAVTKERDLCVLFPLPRIHSS